MALRGKRPAYHAGSWYTSSPKELSTELDEYLDNVPTTLDGHSLPISSARAVIAPHAGYRYSGPCAAWAFKCLDLHMAKRVFVLGPSHTYYLRGCALTTFETYATPFGEFEVDSNIVAQLRGTGRFKDIPRQNDIREHSLEMHLPYVWKMLERAGYDPSGSAWPTLVPIMIGDGDRITEQAFGALLLPYLEDTDNVFIVSSDFCHWGHNFDFWPYCSGTDFGQVRSLVSHSDSGSTRPRADEQPVHEFIRILDEAAFRAIESGSQDAFVDYLQLTENTICGRHPISVTMAALQLLMEKASMRATDVEAKGHKKFAFVRYERSDLARVTSDSSVSYGAGYAIF